jgi:hypothetical protein
MAFKRRDTVRNKIVIDNKIIEEGNLFKYWRNKSYVKKIEIDKKIT